MRRKTSNEPEIPKRTPEQVEATRAREELFHQVANQHVEALTAEMISQGADPVQVHDHGCANSIEHHFRAGQGYCVEHNHVEVWFYQHHTKKPANLADMLHCEIHHAQYGQEVPELIEQTKPRKHQFDLVAVANRVIQLAQVVGPAYQQWRLDQERADKLAAQQKRWIIQHRSEGAELLARVADTIGIRNLTYPHSGPTNYYWRDFIPGLVIWHRLWRDEDYEDRKGCAEELGIEISIYSPKPHGFPLSLVTETLGKVLTCIPGVEFTFITDDHRFRLHCVATEAYALKLLPTLKKILQPLLVDLYEK
jgi:hypothetical protein